MAHELTKTSLPVAPATPNPWHGLRADYIQTRNDAVVRARETGIPQHVIRGGSLFTFTDDVRPYGEHWARIDTVYCTDPFVLPLPDGGTTDIWTPRTE